MKKIKNTKTIIASAALVLSLLGACKGALDIEPQQSISTDKATATKENIVNMLKGAYGEARTRLFSGVLNVYADLLGNSDQVTWNGTFANLRELHAKEMDSNNASANTLYSWSYAIIGRVNLVLANLNKFTDAKEKSKVEGEAAFIRGLLYFELARYFGKAYEAGKANSQPAVPLNLLPPDRKTKLKRSTVEEVYAQAISDLKKAYAQLPDENGGVFADKYAAQAILARVYLQMGDYPAARAAANDIIANSKHKLMPNYKAAFDSEVNVDEYLLAWFVNNQEGSNNSVLYYASQSLGGRGGDISIAEAYLKKFDSPSDVRGKFYYVNKDLKLTSKYTKEFANASPIRLAEMYLIRAETNFREGTAVGASPLQDINTIRKRAEASQLKAVTLADILRERELELAFEGFFLHDYKRTGRKVGKLAHDDNRLVMPIPQSAMDRNDLLTQNPGY